MTGALNPAVSAAQPNRSERLHSAMQRDGATCVWCARPFGALVDPTTEHVVPRAKGGPSWARERGGGLPAVQP